MSRRLVDPAAIEQQLLELQGRICRIERQLEALPLPQDDVVEDLRRQLGEVNDRVEELEAGYTPGAPPASPMARR